MTFAALPFLVVATAVGGEFRTEKGAVRVVTVAEGLDHPWGLAFPPDGRLSAPLAGLPEVWASGQGGLLDVVLDPKFAANRLIYLACSEPGPGGAGTTAARGRLTDRGLDEVSVLYEQTPKLGGGEHFGSRLVFSRDGYLFVTQGERGQRDRAEDLSVDQGKIMRIRPDGNVQGATLHPDTGRLWIAEHGAQGGDEINTPRAGRNYGWPVIAYGVDYSGARIGEGASKPGIEQPPSSTGTRRSRRAAGTGRLPLRPHRYVLDTSSPKAGTGGSSASSPRADGAPRGTCSATSALPRPRSES